MSEQLTVTPLAKQDLVDIAEYIAQNNLDAALRFLDAAEEAFDKLSAMPEMGEAVKSRRIPCLRRWVVSEFPNYTIFYLPTHPKGVEIMRVLQGMRNIPKLF